MNVSAPRQLIGQWLTLFPLRYAEPVIYGLHADRVGSDAAGVRTATGVLLNLDRPLLVTAQHVVESYRNARAKDSRAQLQFAQTLVDLDKMLIDEDRSLDIATIDVSGATIRRETPWSARMPPSLVPFEPQTWPPPDLAEGDVVFFGGYVEAYRRDELGGRVLVHQPYSVSSLAVTGVFTGQFSVRIDRSGWRSVDGLPKHPGLELKDWSGLSGAPIFRFRTVGDEIAPDLVGFVKEHKHDYELLVGSYAHSLKRNGTIWH